MPRPILAVLAVLAVLAAVVMVMCLGQAITRGAAAAEQEQDALARRELRPRHHRRTKSPTTPTASPTPYTLPPNLAPGFQLCVKACVGAANAGNHCQCDGTCDDGYARCPATSAGCTTNIYGDFNNCGACGKKCPAGQYCSGGTCRYVTRA